MMASVQLPSIDVAAALSAELSTDTKLLMLRWIEAVGGTEADLRRWASRQPGAWAEVLALLAMAAGFRAAECPQVRFKPSGRRRKCANRS